MKILMPATHYYPVIGGIETWTRRIAEGLAQKAEVFVVTGKVWGRPDQETVEKVKIYRRSLFILKNFSRSPLFYSLTLLPYVFLKSLSLIKKERIDLLHCQGFLSGILGYLLFKITKAPFIVTVQRMEKRGNFLKEFIYRQAAVCIGVSSPVADYFKAIGCKHVEIIPNGVDVGNFTGLDRQESRAALGIKNEFVIITVARLEKVKGIEYLILSLLGLKSAIADYKLLIIGDGGERKALENLVKKLGLTESVKFLGQIVNERVAEYLIAGDCFVLPSIREGFGIAILEAQAAGIPVIGAKVGGIAEVLAQGQTGLLVPPGDEQSICDALVKIYANPDLALKMVESARENLKNYDWQKIADKVYQIYQKIV
ncbi:MAG: glycosyltransferase family 4 protein [Candidatus Nealsonbacteria bacterium]